MFEIIKNLYLKFKYGEPRIDNGRGFSPMLINIENRYVSKETYSLPQLQNNGGETELKPCLIYKNSKRIKDFDIVSPAIQNISFLEKNLIRLEVGLPKNLSVVTVKTENKNLINKFRKLQQAS